MSNTINTITVVLEKEIREESCENIILAIKMIKGVLQASPNVSDVVEYMAEERVKNEMRKKLVDLFWNT